MGALSAVDKHTLCLPGKDSVVQSGSDGNIKTGKHKRLQGGVSAETLWWGQTSHHSTLSDYWRERENKTTLDMITAMLSVGEQQGIHWLGNSHNHCDWEDTPN